MNTKNETNSNKQPSWLQRFVRLSRIKLAKCAVKILLPRDLWIGNHKGAYTCEWAVHLGKLDNRGVLQGVEDRNA